MNEYALLSSKIKSKIKIILNQWRTAKNDRNYLIIKKLPQKQNFSSLKIEFYIEIVQTKNNSEFKIKCRGPDQYSLKVKGLVIVKNKSNLIRHWIRYTTINKFDIRIRYTTVNNFKKREKRYIFFARNKLTAWWYKKEIVKFNLTHFLLTFLLMKLLIFA